MPHAWSPHRIVLSTACILLAGLVPRAGGVSEAKDAPRPSLWIDDPIHDWGTTYRGQMLQHTFRIANRGNAPLIIREVKSHCGCTVASGGKPNTRLLPGEETSITIHLDTTLQRGRVKKDTEILTNAPGDFRLWMQGEVIDLLKLDPSLPKVEFVRGSSVPLPITKVAVTPGLPKKIRIRRVKTLKGILAAKVREVERGKRYELELSPKVSGTKDDAFRTETLELSTEVDGKVLPLRVQVSVILKDRIEVTPSPSVYIHRKQTARMLEAGAPAPSKVLEIHSIGGPKHRFTIQEATCRNGTFRASVEPIKEGKAYRLTVTLVKHPPEGKRFLKDSIRIETDDPLVPAITIPAMAQF